MRAQWGLGAYSPGKILKLWNVRDTIFRVFRVPFRKWKCEPEKQNEGGRGGGGGGEEGEGRLSHRTPPPQDLPQNNNLPQDSPTTCYNPWGFPLHHDRICSPDHILHNHVSMEENDSINDIDQRKS